MRGKRLWWLAALIPLAALAWFGLKTFGPGAANQTAEADTTQVVAVTRGSLVASIDPTGQVEAVRQVELNFDVTRIPLVELNVSAGQQIKQGDVLARIDTESLQRAVDQAEANMLSAQDALETAQAPYSALDQQKAAADVAQAETALQEARQALDELQNPDLADAQQAVRDASTQLQQAKTRLASLQSDKSVQEQIDNLQWRANVAEVDHGGLLNQTVISEEGQDKEWVARNKMLDAQDSLETVKLRAQLDLLTAQNNVTQAQRALAEAQESLAKLQAGPDELALAQARNKLAQAEYNLAKAQQAQADIAAGPSSKDVQLAQARYAAAVATFDEAQTALANATMVAPFDGTVLSTTNAQIGDLVSSGDVIAVVADLTQLRVVTTVDETEISQVQVGQDATITFDALSGQRFVGKVLEVPLESTLSQNVVTYQVPVSLEGADGAALRPGMTANVSITTGRQQDVLLLPVLAVQQGENGHQAYLEDGSATPVEIGLNDGQYVEVKRGLNEGDRVLVVYADTPSQQNFGRMGIGGMGGAGARVIVR